MKIAAMNLFFRIRTIKFSIMYVPVCFVTGKGTGASALGVISQIAATFSLTVKLQHPSFIAS
jgi:hypothetical protein